MNYRKSIYRKHRKNSKIKHKRIRRSIKNKRGRRRQSGGFIGTMFNAALTPVKMISKPIMNKLSSMMSNSNSNSNSNNISNNISSISGGGSVDGSTLNNIRMNNSNISSLKQLSSYGYDNRTLTSYINQLQHINL